MFEDGPGYACKIDWSIDGGLHVQIIKEELEANMDYYGKSSEYVVFSNIMTQSTLAKRPKVGLKIVIWRL